MTTQDDRGIPLETIVDEAIGLALENYFENEIIIDEIVADVAPKIIEYIRANERQLKPVQADDLISRSDVFTYLKKFYGTDLTRKEIENINTIPAISNTVEAVADVIEALELE